jgi:hypothetical protein
MFTTKFDAYVCEDDRITCKVDGFTAIATVYRDDDATPPWEDEDGHGPVSEWTRRAKRPGERVLIEDRGSRRYYDFEGAVEMAKREEWDAPPYQTGTKGERAVRAVERDFALLKAWCEDKWFYCGIVLTVRKGGVQIIDECGPALWRIEANAPGSDNSYLSEVANELLDEAIDAAREAIAEQCEGE